MKTLVINSGSSSLKYTLFDMAHETVLFAGGIERIGLPGGVHVSRFGSDEETRKAVNVGDHGQALDGMLATLIAGPLESLDQLTAVAHRVGHGGKYWDAVRIDNEVLAEIRRMTPMIPLHHPAMIEEIEECRVRMPHAVHVAVFDTWFHKSIPVEASIYGLPYRYFAERGYRRTGFHGNSHAYVSLTAAQFLRRNLDELKVISCHLGNGASICAIARGKSIDTTLGMTAVEGLIMGTRSGDVDPGLIPIIMEEDSLSPGDLIDLLYKESGLKGISGVSSDMREVEAAAEQGNERAVLALSAFCYKVKRSIGAMLMVLGGCDVLIFTGGIGCNRPTVRSKALAGTERLGFVIDEALNSRACAESPVTDISPPSLPTRILVIRTFEELMMARQCVQAIGWTPGSE